MLLVTARVPLGAEHHFSVQPPILDDEKDILVVAVRCVNGLLTFAGVFHTQTNEDTATDNTSE